MLEPRNCCPSPSTVYTLFWLFSCAHGTTTGLETSNCNCMQFVSISIGRHTAQRALLSLSCPCSVLPVTAHPTSECHQAVKTSNCRTAMFGSVCGDQFINRYVPEVTRIMWTQITRLHNHYLTVCIWFSQMVSFLHIVRLYSCMLSPMPWPVITEITNCK